ncbi:hypothetical protein ACFL2U_02585 [Patescibacteria group bacterium]
MSPKIKKIALITGFLIIVAVLGFAIYYFLFRPLFFVPEEPVTPTVTLPPTTGLPPIAPATNVSIPSLLNQVSALPSELPTTTDRPTIPGPEISEVAIGGLTTYTTLETNPSQQPTLANNGRDLIYYEKDSGFFYQMDSDGNKQLFSDATFKNVENITWAGDNSKAVLEYPDGSNIIYDFNKKASVTLPKHWEDFTFSNTNDQIAFKDMRIDPENRYIAISDTNGTAYQPVEKLGDKDDDVYVSWAPNNKYIALYKEGLDFNRSVVYPVGFNRENYKSFRVEGSDFRHEWSPSGNKILYSVFNSRSGYNPTLWVANSNPELLGTGRTKLEIDTWADKCTFADEGTIYCAVPKKMSVGTGFNQTIADNTPDEIYKIDILTGTKELVAEPLYSTTVEQMVVSEDKSTLFWLEKNTGQIKKLNL